MTDTQDPPPDDDPPPQARVRPRHWFSWVWLIPLVAIAIVAWLAIRTLAQRGPVITISFTDAQGLQAGDTRIRHKDVDLGTVESLHLTRDMSRVVVRARMRRSAISHLTANTRFWIVRPRVGFGGISGLSTLVSGSYIEMYPGTGAPQRSFIGLDQPPPITPDEPGRSFTLRSSDLGSLVAGSSVSYHGVEVGEIEGFALDSDGRQISIYAFIHAPYEKLVTPQSRFWNSGGINVAIGVQGVSFRASSWQQLLSGGVSFDNPADSTTGSSTSIVPSPAGSVFQLYDNQGDSQRDPRGATLVYQVVFPGGAGGVGIGTGVLLGGTEIGQVTDVRLQYDDTTQSLRTQVTLRIDPSRVEIIHPRTHDPDPHGTADPSAAFEARLRHLVARGLRARVTSANFLTGSKVISLDMIQDVPPGHIETTGSYPQLPSTGANDVTAILASVQSVLHHIDTATAGPELGHAIKKLDQTLTHLDQIATTTGPQIQSLLSSLRETSAAAQRTLQAAHNLLGTSAASGADLPRLIRELTDAARSVRELTDYLDRHPEALIRGRRGDSR